MIEAKEQRSSAPEDNVFHFTIDINEGRNKTHNNRINKVVFI